METHMQTIQIGKKISIKLLFSISKAVSLKQLALPARVNLIKQADIGRPFWVSNRRTSLRVTAFKLVAGMPHNIIRNFADRAASVIPHLN
jgi:hypothetical protein